MDRQEVAHRARHLLIWGPVTAFAVGVASTQFIAWQLHYHPALGPPVVGHIYWPWRSWQWWHAPWEPSVARTFTWVGLGLAATSCVALLALSRAIRKRPRKHMDVHGTARFATEADVRTSGLLPPHGQAPQTGIIVGGWTHANGSLSYLTHTAKSHVLCLGPTRSGKTQSTMIPTLLTWPGSAIVYDPKGELFQQTAAWREQEGGNRVMRFAPAEIENTIAWNPLDRVRIGTDYAFRDVANIITQVADPIGKGMSDHWEPSGANFLIGLALFNLALHGQSSLSEVLSTIDASADVEVVLRAMAACSVKEVAEVGRGMLATSATRERPSIISTARRQLMTYRDPVLARNTASSDFTINDLMNDERPVTLYIEARGEDELRLRPLIRLFLTLAIGQLISTPPVIVNGREQIPHRHPLLLAIDEFASLGRMEPMEVALSKSAGAGITALLLCQDHEQIVSAYGQHENITGHCSVISAYAPNNAATAEWLSDKTGQSTVVMEDVSESQQQGLGRRSQSNTFRSIGRPLMTADEVTRLRSPTRDASGLIISPGELLVFQAGQHVIRATQSLAFRDPEFRRRMALASNSMELTV